MEQLPKIVVEQLRSGLKPDVHPDADLLTAFIEECLPERERLGVAEHLSACAECREVVFLAEPEMAIQQLAVPAASWSVAASPAPAHAHWPGKLNLGWATIAACVVIAAVLVGYQAREKRMTQMAAREAGPALNAESDQNSTQDAAPVPNTNQPAARAGEQFSARLEPPPEAKLKARMEDYSRENDLRAEKDLRSSAPGHMKLPMAAPAEDKAAQNTAGAGLAISPGTQVLESSGQLSPSKEEAEAASTPAPQPDLPMQARATNESVVAQAETAAAPPPAAPAPGKQSAQASSSPIKTTDSIGAFSRRTDLAKSAGAQMRPNAAAARISSGYRPSRWMISPDGSTLMRSTDQGQSWFAIKVASNVAFRAVAAFGSEVWAGGKSGALYHSSDLGMHWTQINPVANGTTLIADIVAVDFADAHNGKLITSEGRVWTTADGGKTWQTP